MLVFDMRCGVHGYSTRNAAVLMDDWVCRWATRSSSMCTTPLDHCKMWLVFMACTTPLLLLLSKVKGQAKVIPSEKE
jgi:hypothetical protein